MIDGTVGSQRELRSASGSESALSSSLAGLFTDSDYRKFLDAFARRDGRYAYSEMVRR